MTSLEGWYIFQVPTGGRIDEVLFSPILREQTDLALLALPIPLILLVAGLLLP